MNAFEHASRYNILGTRIDKNTKLREKKNREGKRKVNPEKKREEKIEMKDEKRKWNKELNERKFWYEKEKFKKRKNS